MSLTKTDKDMICPLCGVQVETAWLRELAQDGGHAVREYIGDCGACGHGFDVIQFRRDGRWAVHKFRPAEPGQRAFDREWHVVTPLPGSPLVMLGPGGDYVKTIEDDQIRKDCLTGIANCYATLTTLFQVLLGLDHGKKHG
jgi:hypothetical protein